MTDDELEALADTDERTLPGHRSKVTLADGTTWEVRVTNRDYIAWDKTAPRKKWPNAKDAPFLSSTFMAWSASKREGLTGLTFDQFCEQCEEVGSPESDEDDVARPTRPGPEPGS